MSRSDAIKRTGEMMLSGWKLLGIICPICNSPLMSKGDHMRCPGCDMPVRMESEMENVQYEVKGEAEFTLCGDESGRKEDGAEVVDDDSADSFELIPDPPQSMEEMKKEYDRRNETRDKVSAKLGERMLAGWTMLGFACPRESCQGTPLMNRKDHDMVCVACETNYVYSQNGEIVEKKKATDLAAESQLKEKSPTKAGGGNAPPLSAYGTLLEDAPFLPSMFQSRKSDPADMLSKKLLMGWAMLEAVCDGPCNGSVPLMRDKTGTIRCVVCEDTQAQAQAQAQAHKTQSSLSRTSVSASKGQTGAGTATGIRSSKRDRSNPKYEEDEDEGERHGRGAGGRAHDDDDDDDEEVEDADDSLAFSSYTAQRLAELTQGPEPESAAGGHPAKQARATTGGYSDSVATSLPEPPPLPCTVARDQTPHWGDRGGGGIADMDVDAIKSFALKALSQKIKSAAVDLGRCEDLSQSKLLAQLIAALADAVTSLQKVET